MTAGVEGVVIDADDERGVDLLAWRRDDDAPRARLEVASSALTGRETPGGLDHDVDVETAPPNCLRVPLLEDRHLTITDPEALVGLRDLDTEPAEGGVVTEKVHVHLARDEVVDRDDLDARGLSGLCLEGDNRSQEIPPDPSEAVDADANAQVDHLSRSRSFKAVSAACEDKDILSHLPRAPQNVVVNEQGKLGPQELRVMFAKTGPGHVRDHERDLVREFAERERGPVRHDDIDFDTVGTERLRAVSRRRTPRSRATVRAGSRHRRAWLALSEGPP